MELFYNSNNDFPELGNKIELGQPLTSSFASPSEYIPDKGLVAAVNTALILGQPLLLTGEPGTGKTQLAYHVARKLGLLQPIKYEVKSNSNSIDLFYTVDSMRQFRDNSFKEKGETVDPLDYIEFQALGLAIMRSIEPESLGDLRTKVEHNGRDQWSNSDEKLAFPHRSVVLIDEIDKAPRDVPNDLLNEVENAYFNIPELKSCKDYDEKFQAPDELRPLVIFTSNSEKNLPDAFLRRCVYYNIEFPDKNTLLDIVMSRMAKMEMGKKLVNEVLDLVLNKLRKGHKALDKKPGTAEVLAFLMALKRQGVATDCKLKECVKQAKNAAGTLGKNPKDLEKVKKHLQDASNN